MTANEFTPEVAAIIERVRRLTADEIGCLDEAAQDAVWGAAWAAACNAACNAACDSGRTAAWEAMRGATRDAVPGAAWDAVWVPLLATLVRDLITPEQYDALIGPWRSVVGEVAS